MNNDQQSLKPKLNAPLKQSGDISEQARSGIKFHFDNKYYHTPRIYDAILLYQVGDLSVDSGFSIGNHDQFCYEISYIASGSGYYWSNDRCYPVKAGDIYLSLPGEQHDGQADRDDPFRYYYIGFGFDESQSEYGSLVHIQRMFDQVKMPVTADKFGIYSPFLGIFNEMINLKAYSDLLIKTYIVQIITFAYRNFFDSWERQYTRENGTDKNYSPIYEIIHYIDSNLESETIIQLIQLEEELGYSYSHLSRLFSQTTGSTIKQYFNRKRFEKAVQLLKDSTCSITHISEKLGYQSIHTFSKAFRKSYGLSPTEYQQMIGNIKKGTID
ncbi:AraC family transcriptional regulator [Cohnella sp. WQ 127256]|uniref:AraC family transcriptional regulator n=1 Tax=Cohnella sp. WQ 127256 TaxID=2938790 RepID=UPI0021178322|nr:AraC family transcriptional regulator [Cohnella sp. WQ 127256]